MYVLKDGMETFDPKIEIANMLIKGATDESKLILSTSQLEIEHSLFTVQHKRFKGIYTFFRFTGKLSI